MNLGQAQLPRVPLHVILHAEQRANPQYVKTASTLSWTEALLRFHNVCWYFHVWWCLWSVQFSVNLNCFTYELRIVLGFGRVNASNGAFVRLEVGLQNIRLFLNVSSFNFTAYAPFSSETVSKAPKSKHRTPSGSPTRRSSNERPSQHA